MGNGKCWWLRGSSSFRRISGSKVWFLLIFSCATIAARQPHEIPGCHLAESTENISIPGCEEFLYAGNACVGYCDSWAVARKASDLEQNPLQVITSASSCCDMDETEDDKVWIECRDGRTEFTFRTAKSCKCLQCKKDSN